MEDIYLAQASGPPIRYSDTSPPVTDTPVPGSVPNADGMGAMEHIYADGNISLLELVQMFIVYAFIIVAALSAIFIFVGGVSFILSGGNDDKIKQAVNTIRYSIIGLIITILSFTVVTIVGRIFGFHFLDYISFQQIKEAVNRVISTGESPVDDFRQR